MGLFKPLFAQSLNYAKKGSFSRYSGPSPTKIKITRVEGGCRPEESIVHGEKAHKSKKVFTNSEVNDQIRSKKRGDEAVENLVKDEAIKER
jgi:hypothetical protein